MNIRRISLFFAIALLSTALSACSTDDTVGNDDTDPGQNQNGAPDVSGDVDGEGDADINGGAQDTHGGDQDVDGGDQDVDGDDDAGPDANGGDPETHCESIADTSATFELPTDSGAYYGRLTFAGDHIWAIYITAVEIDGDSYEKAHLARIGCDGEIIDGPTMIGADEAIRDIHPAIAASDSIVFAAWGVEDDGNQQLMARAFDIDGTPLQSEPFYVVPQLKTGETIGTVWKPDLAVTYDDNAVLVVEALTTADPRVIMQRFDSTGEPVLSGFFVHDSPDHGGQQDPTVAVMEDGSIQFAYLGGEFGEGRVFHGVVAPDAEEVDSPPVAAQPTETVSYSVRLSEPAVGGFTWMTYPVGTSLSNQHVIRDATTAGPTDTQSVAVANRLSLHGDIAASPTGGAVAWMTYDSSPIQRRVHFQRFDATSDGTITATGTRVDQHDQDDASWPYGPSIIWLYGDVYAALWTENTGGISVQGRILELP